MQSSQISTALFLIGVGSLEILEDHTLIVIMMFVFMLVLNLTKHIGITSIIRATSSLCKNGEVGGGGFEFMTLSITHRISGLKEFI